MKQDNKTKWENELQALKNIVSNLQLNGIDVYVNHNGGRKNPTYFLRDETGNTITGSWDYTRLNHFIMGYGKAFNKFNPSLSLPEETIKEDNTMDWDLYPGNEAGAFDHLDKEVSELEEDLFNQPTGTPPIKEQSSNRGEGDMWFMNSIDEDCAIVSDDKGFILEAPDMETGRELCKRWNEAPELAKENQALRESNTRLKEALKRIAECEGLPLDKYDAEGFTKIAKEALTNNNPK